MNNKKKFKKIFKLIFFTTSITAITLSTFSVLVSCNHHNTNPKKGSWDVFKKDALRASFEDIIKATQPPAWNNIDKSDFEFQDQPAVETDNLTITATIIRKSNSALAKFRITYVINTNYNLDDWKCYGQPTTPEEANWEHFRDLATSVLPKDLIKRVRDSDVVNALRWTYGNESQTKWITTDQAEFDIYGGVGAGDDYAGMAGEPTTNNNDQTITAIISKKGKNGAYDSDPIKAMISYYQGSTYNIKSWKFTKIVQLQSVAKYNTLLNKEISDGLNNINQFLSSNWMSFQKDPNGPNSHSQDYQIRNYLNKNGFPSNADFKINSFDKIFIPAIEKGPNILRRIIEISFRVRHTSGDWKNHSMNLEVYRDKTKLSLEAFNYTWKNVYVYDF